ncbi:MAG: EAL domain-containing protein [Sulfurimonas sp.]|nr:EAL domain-containing protein [Sulfurimonas sp.]
MSKLADISVLYVEDEQVVRESVTRSLSLLIENISSAENGFDALEYVRNNPVDLIVTDIRMPKMDGLTFIEKLRQDGINIPVIVTSAFNDIEYFQKAIELKVDKFITKPIRIANLIEVMTHLVDSIILKRSLALRLQELEYYRKAIDTTSVVMRIDADGNLISMNKELGTFFQLQSDLPIDTIDTIAFFTPALLDTLLVQTKEFKVFNTTTMIRFDNQVFTVQLSAFASVLQKDRVSEITILLNDISPLIKEKDAMIEQLYIDELTGCYNRQKLFYDLQTAEATMAIILFDIERFSNINYLYGYDSGDIVLKQIVKLLNEYWPDEYSRTLYRTDMDHFIILTPKASEHDRDRIENLTKQLIKHIEDYEFVIGDTLSINVGVTVGVSCAGESDLYIEASIALAVAKEQHRPFMCYTDLNGVKERFENNLTMQRKIKTALDTNKIVNYYQAIVDADGKLLKYEALIRMEDPEQNGHILTPYYFLDIARESKNYSLLTKRVITTAFSDFGDGSQGVSINLSFDDIANPEVTEYLESLMLSHPNARITLELLESEGLKDIDKTIEFCNQMKNYGAKIAIDDFGSGYSNFVYFFDMPIDILKIDGSLIKRVHETQGFIALETITTFAKNLGMEIVAEFVEDEAIFNKLKSLEINMFQGYYFAKPKPFSEL